MNARVRFEKHFRIGARIGAQKETRLGLMMPLHSCRQSDEEDNTCAELTPFVPQHQPNAAKSAERRAY